MRYASRARLANRLVVSILLSTALVGVYVGAVGQTSVPVSAIVCKDDTIGTFVLTTQPRTAAYATLPMAISGDIEYISQLRISVDGVYRETMPIDSGATSFTYSYMYPVTGAHTVTFEAIPICQTTTITESISLEYKPPTPAVSASPSANTSSAQSAQSTSEPGVPSATNMATHTEVPTAAHANNSSEQGAIPRLIQDNITPVVAFLGVDSSTPLTAVTTTGRVTFATAGVAAIVLATPIVNLAGATSVGRAIASGARTLPPSLRARPRAATRVIGAVLLIASIILMP